MFESFSLKLSKTYEKCSENFLLIEDLTGVHRLCGSSNGVYLSTAPQIRVQFIGNWSENFEGFKLKVITETVKDFKRFKMQKGTLTLPEVTNSYPKEGFSTWMIEAPDKYHIALSCNYTVKNKHKNNCYEGGLYISNEPSMKNGKRYCTNFPKEINSKKNKLFFIFHSTENQEQDFKCFYDIFTDIKHRYVRSPRRHKRPWTQQRQLSPWLRPWLRPWTRPRKLKPWLRLRPRPRSPYYQTPCECSKVRFEVPMKRKGGKMISGGDPVGDDHVPWIVAITQSGGYLLCGGALIAVNVVLTAAHCFHEILDAAWLSVVIENYNPLDLMQTTNENDYRIVKSFHTHPNFDFLKKTNDIAIMFIDAPEYKTFICLPPFEEDLEPGMFVRMYGWGTTANQKVSLLQKIEKPILSLSECQKKWSDLSDITSNMICVSSAHGDTTCEGDSGGPLIRDINILLRIVGIISYGDGLCNAAAMPSVNTRVASYLSWILETAKMECVPPD